MNTPTIKELNDSVTSVLGSKIKIRLVKDLVYTFGGFVIVVPRRYVSDGTTTPFFIRAFVDRFDIRFLAAAILHDYLIDTQFVERPVADQFFRMVLKETAPFFLRLLYYIGVRIGTTSAWARKKRQGLMKFNSAKVKANDMMRL